MLGAAMAVTDDGAWILFGYFVFAIPVAFLIARTVEWIVKKIYHAIT